VHRASGHDGHPFAQVAGTTTRSSGRRLAIWLIGAAIVVVLAAAALFVGFAPSTGINVGQQAPPLTGTTIDGRTVNLADFRGRPVVVNFWASWCIPCRQEFPLFKDEQAAHPELVFLGVVYHDTPDLARAFVADQGATWPSLIDPGDAMATAYKMAAPPQSYFIDASGIIRSRQIGTVSREDFDRQYAAIAK